MNINTKSSRLKSLGDFFGAIFHIQVGSVVVQVEIQRAKQLHCLERTSL